MVTDEEVSNIMQQYQQELAESNMNQRKLASSQLSLFGGNVEENFVKWQLNLEEEKERIYHILKGHRVKEDENGNIVYEEPLDKNSQILSDFGVDYVMGLLESFMNRNIILSNFDLERVNQICLDLGEQIANDMFVDSERMGLDTEDKIKQYPMIVMKVVINVEAALRRAMNEGERKSLRSIISVTQNDNPRMYGNMQMPMPVYQPQQKSKLNPLNWFKT